MADKTKGQQLREDLFYKKKTAFELKNSEQLAEVMEYAKEYMHFLDVAKTEREAVIYAIEKLEAAGFKAYKLGDKLEAGDKIYYNNRGKSLFAIRVGTEDIEENGIRIIAAHVDSPRLDLKQHPLYESEHFGYLKTHYYGGVRKYQWVTIPLALHGVVTKKNGETVEIRIGDQPGDPVLCITDLLPHLAKDQNGRSLGSAFDGEGMNAIIASSPYLEEDG
ncbi:MAG: aminopeptidase, partial [Clostridia bacterium]|nr:aminopeptidase [Clostridia bacterium]